MYRKQVRRRRAILVLLVVGCLMLISISIGEADSGPLSSVQSGVASVLNPVGEGASRALKPARDLVNWFDETLDARGENDQLKSQVAKLRTELLDTRTAAEKAGYAEQLDKLIAESDLSGYEPIGASVIGRSPSAWYARITIDAGSSDGVAKNDAVVTADGLIGRVEEVFGGSSQVSLITDTTNAVTARVAGKGPEGLVEPIVGEPGKLNLGLIQGKGDLSKGEDLITAGFSSSSGPSSRYPGGIPIGEVDETLPAQQQQDLEVRIKPFADLVDLSEVSVLSAGGGS